MSTIIKVVIKADGVVVDTVLASQLLNSYWSNESLSDEFKKYKCVNVLEHYCNGHLLCKFTNGHSTIEETRNLKIIIKADGVVVDTVLSSKFSDTYWTDKSLSDEFEKYKCVDLLEHYCSNVLLCKFTKDEVDFFRYCEHLNNDFFK